MKNSDINPWCKMLKADKRFIDQISPNEFYLHPEGIFVGQGNISITTLLGSCVGVAIEDTTQMIGGLNHYLLPKPLFGESNGNKFGVFAIPQLIINLQVLGARRKNLQAKIFGGSNLLTVGSANVEIGKLNIDIARKLLKEMNIPIIEENLGGQVGRRICLHIDTFKVDHFFV